MRHISGPYPVFRAETSATAIARCLPMDSVMEAMMRGKTITYWISTIFVVCIMAVSGGLAILHASPFMRALAHLGYPPYFSNLLGVGKLVGIFVLLLPGLPRMKEWAYVAFAITLLSACCSHFSSGDGLLALDPLVTFGALVASYNLRPADRRLSDPSRI